MIKIFNEIVQFLKNLWEQFLLWLLSEPQVLPPSKPTIIQLNKKE